MPVVLTTRCPSGKPAPGYGFPGGSTTWWEAGAIFSGTLGSLKSSPFNETHWNDPEYVSLYKQANATTDESKRKDLVYAMQKIDFDRGGYIIAAYNKLLDITTSRVHGFEPAGTGIVLGNADWAHAWMS